MSCCWEHYSHWMCCLVMVGAWSSYCTDRLLKTWKTIAMIDSSMIRCGSLGFKVAGWQWPSSISAILMLIVNRSICTVRLQNLQYTSAIHYSTSVDRWVDTVIHACMFIGPHLYMHTSFHKLVFPHLQTWDASDGRNNCIIWLTA